MKAAGAVGILVWALSASAAELPPRAQDAPAASTVLSNIASLPLTQREAILLREILHGNFPDWWRNFQPVEVTDAWHGGTNRATIFVSPDYLCVGSEKDYCLMPLSPGAAQQIADSFGCMLPTRKLVNDIYGAAKLKLPPHPLAPGPEMITIPAFSNHNALILSERDGFVGLIAGHKKDLVLSPQLDAHPGKVAIYGWHRSDGTPIQPLYLGHTNTWVDYSQCARMVSRSIVVNGATQDLASAIGNPSLAALFSDEGTVMTPRYPTNIFPVYPALKPALALFTPAGRWSEQTLSYTFDPEVKVHINAPSREELESAREIRLVFFGLPNGNTIEQTIGRKSAPGLDWHFDIQHIGAQVRFLRSLSNSPPLVIAYLQAEQKSWPAWRKKYGDEKIPVLLSSITNIFSDRKLRITFSGHSGGGSLFFGWLNSVDRIPDNVERIAFLDSNYAYDPAKHHDQKLAEWLERSPVNSLCVLAYNDAVALLDGKPFVSAAGGTWGRSHAMISDLQQQLGLTCRTNDDFEICKGRAGRVRFELKKNPDRKIFHTVQVERNGFIHSMLTGTTNESKGYDYFGARAYEAWIE